VLVLGATGGFGRAIALELAGRGANVRGLARDPARAAERLGAGIEIVAGDAQDAATIARAAAGCTLVVHAVNAPYHQWDPLMRTITARVVATCREAGARLVFPGNVYGFGPETTRAVAEDAPQEATTRKGRLRAEIEFMIQRGTDDRKMSALVVRSGDFYGPTVRNGLVDRIFGNAVAGKTMTALGRLEMPHQWAYVPDLARLTADLLERGAELRPHEVVHFAGHVVTRLADFLREVAAAAGRPELRMRALPWWWIRLAGPFDPTARELIELRYLFDEAVILDDPRRRQLLPDFQPTPLASAIATTTGSYRAALTP
jgi:nucleoside-diphosphate-sugar epimerase